MTSVLDPPTSVDSWLELVEAEYRAMPGLCLTKPQMQRLWGFDAVLCDALVDTLISKRVLHLTARGQYAVRGGCDHSTLGDWCS